MYRKLLAKRQSKTNFRVFFHWLTHSLLEFCKRNLVSDQPSQPDTSDLLTTCVFEIQKLILEGVGGGEGILVPTSL